MKKHLMKVVALLLSIATGLFMGCKPEKKHVYVLDASGICNGYGYVDLDLPSGTLWAVCNVGAVLPEECGDYFAWGERQVKEYYHWNTYAFSRGDQNQLTKYCDSVTYGLDGFTDDLIALLPEDDAAANWGEGWHTPTSEDWEELYWRGGLEVDIATINDVEGWLFTSWNGNSLFLPYAGYRFGSQCYRLGVEGKYWANSLDTVIPFKSHCFQQNSVMAGMSSSRRFEGLPVRAVCKIPRK